MKKIIQLGLATVSSGTLMALGIGSLTKPQESISVEQRQSQLKTSVIAHSIKSGSASNDNDYSPNFLVKNTIQTKLTGDNLPLKAFLPKLKEKVQITQRQQNKKTTNKEREEYRRIKNYIRLFSQILAYADANEDLILQAVRQEPDMTGKWLGQKDANGSLTPQANRIAKMVRYALIFSEIKTGIRNYSPGAFFNSKYKDDTELNNGNIIWYYFDRSGQA